MARYSAYTDPGHGWTKVSKKELRRLGIANQISRASYMRGDYAYLEEDGDTSTWARAKEARGEPFELEFKHTDKSSRIRGYAPYQNLTPSEEAEYAEKQRRLLGIARQADHGYLKTRSLDEIRKLYSKYFRPDGRRLW